MIFMKKIEDIYTYAKTQKTENIIFLGTGGSSWWKNVSINKVKFFKNKKTPQIFLENVDEVN